MGARVRAVVVAAASMAFVVGVTVGSCVGTRGVEAPADAKAARTP